MRVLRLYKAASQGSPNNRPATSGFPMAYSRIKDVCILLLESKEKKYFWKSCFFFFLCKILHMALETWREASFKWHCLFLYLFLHGK